MKKRLLPLLLAGLMTLGLAGCDDSEDVPLNGSVSEVSLSQNSIDVQLGKRSSDVTVTVTGEGDYSKKVKLTSDNEKIATASFTEVSSGETFKVYGLAVGTATINVVSLHDETKAASLSVTVKSKEVIDDPEILSFYVSETSKMFEVNGASHDFELTVTGKGDYNPGATISVTQDLDHPCISLNKTEVASGEKFTVTPLGEAGEAAVNLTSKEDPSKTAQIQIAVKDPTPPEPVVSEDIRLDFDSRTLTVDDVFSVQAVAIGGDVTWKLREKGSTTLSDTSQYLEIVSSSNSGATVKALKVVDEVTLVATVGEHSAECVFKVEDAPTDVRELYVSKNANLNFEDIYFYAWNDKDQHNAEWPGEKLTEYVENTSHELCYKFTVDILKYPNFKFNNGKSGDALKETIDCSFEGIDNNDNVWFDADGYHFAQIQRDVPSISFIGVYGNALTLGVSDIKETIQFKFNKGTPAYGVSDDDSCIEVTDFIAGSFKIEAKKVGSASIKIYLEEHPEVEATLSVTIVDASEMTTLYFSNSLNWSAVYLYMWGEGEGNNNGWPGQKLSSPVKNKEGQDVYVLHIPAQYTSLVLNNGEGAQSVNIDKDDSHLVGEINNLWLTDETDDDGHYKFGFAKYDPMVYTIRFGEEGDTDNHVTLDMEGRIVVPVTSSAGGVNYNVASGSDFVSILGSSSDSSLVLEWKEAGEATIVATVGDASDTLYVTCTNNPAVKEDVVYIFSNNQGWENIYLYAWGPGGQNAGWPGVKVTDNIGKNKFDQDLYQFAVDTLLYDSFLLNEGDGLRQTDDIVLSEHPVIEGNNIWIGDQIGDSSKYTPMFSLFHPIEPAKSSVTIEEGLNTEIEIYSVIPANQITVQSLDGSVATTTQIISGHITVTGVNTGHTKITLTYGSGDNEIVEEIDVTVVEENKQDYYFYKGYDHYTDFSLYLFDSVSSEAKSAWPGDPITGETYKNSSGKECYKVTVDRNKYDSFILVAKDGTEERQTVDGLFDDFTGKNMFGFATSEGSWEQKGDKWYCHIEAGVYAPFVYSIAFNEDSITVPEEHDVTVGVLANASGVTYEVTSGSDKVSIASHTDSSVTLHYLAAGEAEITATLHGVTAVLEVTTTAEPLPPDPKTFIFSNNQGWEHVYLYAFGEGDVQNAAWPGVELTTVLGQNIHGQDLYEFEVDKNLYTAFLLNEGTDGKKSSDIVFSTISDFSLNNIYLDENPVSEGSKEYAPHFVEFHALETGVANVTLEEGKTSQVTVSCVYGNSVTVTSNDPSVATTSQVVEGKITISGVKVGTTSITLSYDDGEKTAQATIAVEVVEENIQTFYFYNSYSNFTGLHLYLFNSVTKEAKTAFPGDALTGETVKNQAGKDCYAVEVNLNDFDSFILVAWQNSDQKQTDDVKFSDHATSNMFSFATDSSAWHETEPGSNVWKCSINAETFEAHVHSFDATTHLCSCGEAEEGYVAITFTMTYGTEGGQHISIVGIPDWDTHIAMNSDDNMNWHVTVALKANQQVSFKYIVVNDSEAILRWEGGNDRKFTPTVNDTYVGAWQE